MFNLDKLSEQKVYILRHEPSHIYSFSIILLISMLIFIVIGNFWYYTKQQSYVALVSYDEEYVYLELEVPLQKLKNFKTNKLIINDKEYQFEIIEVQKNNNDNNYKVILKVINLKFEKETLIIVKLQTSPTTIFKEIIKRLKEDLDY